MKNKRNIQVIAHRGASEFTPENTLASFKKAIELGVDSIEFDLLQTKDGYLVVHHDYSLGRTNNGKGFVHETFFKDIRKLDAGSWFDKKFAGEKIPTLKEVIELCKGRCKLEIELKLPNRDFLEKVLAVLKKENILKHVEVTSFNSSLLVLVKQIEPQLKTGLIFQECPDWMPVKLGEYLVIQQMKLVNANVAHLPKDLVNENMIKMLRDQKKEVHVHCDKKKDIIKAINLKVDQFSTNKTALALKIRDGGNKGIKK